MYVALWAFMTLAVDLMFYSSAQSCSGPVDSTVSCSNSCRLNRFKTRSGRPTPPFALWAIWELKNHGALSIWDTSDAVEPKKKKKKTCMTVK